MPPSIRYRISLAPDSKPLDLMKDITEVTNRIQELSETNAVVVVGVTGGSCSGKSFISNMLSNSVKGAILPMDDYYRGIESTEDANFDKPDTLDLGLLKEHITEPN